MAPLIISAPSSTAAHALVAILPDHGHAVAAPSTDGTWQVRVELSGAPPGALPRSLAAAREWLDECGLQSASIVVDGHTHLLRGSDRRAAAQTSAPPGRPRGGGGFVREPRPHHGASAVKSSTVPAVDERPRLVFFTAETSGPSRQAEGWIAQILQHRRNHRKIKLVPVDTEARPELAQRFRVERLPTLIVVEDKVAKARLECPRGAKEIAAMLAPWLL